MRTQVAVTAIGAVTLLAACLAWWLQTAAPADPHAGMLDRATQGHEAMAESLHPEQAHALPPPDSSGLRTVVEPEEAPAVRSCFATLEVVFADTEQPAAGAQVWYWPPSSARGQDDVGESDQDLEVVLRSFGRSTLTDARGSAEFACDPDSTCCVRAGNRYAEFKVSGTMPADVRRRVALELDVAIQAEVVDEHGNPVAGIKLDGRATFVSRRDGREDYTFVFGPTDAEGRARLAHLQCLIPLPGPAVIDWSLRVQCRGQHLDTSVRNLTLAQLTAATPLRFVLPVGGDLVLQILGSDGQPIAGHARLSIAEPGYPSVFATRGIGAEHWFRCLPLGRTWTAWGSAGEVHTSATVAGPTQASEVVRAVLRVDVQRWVVRGRLLQSKSPVVNAEVSCVGLRDEGKLHRLTNPQGEFELAAVLPRGPARRCQLDIDHESVPLDLVLDCPVEIGPGITDLGDLDVPSLPEDHVLLTVQVRCGLKTLPPPPPSMPRCKLETTG